MCQSNESVKTEPYLEAILLHLVPPVLRPLAFLMVLLFLTILESLLSCDQLGVMERLARAKREFVAMANCRGAIRFPAVKMMGQRVAFLMIKLF